MLIETTSFFFWLIYIVFIIILKTSYMCLFLCYVTEFPFSPKKLSQPFQSPEGKSLPSPCIVPQNVIISPEYPPSPKKHLLSPRGSDHPLSPRKNLTNDHLHSPRRNLLSPKKSDFSLSPRKMMSPNRNENVLPSRNLLMSPGTMMSNLSLSSPVRIPLSPRKMDNNIMASPGKSKPMAMSPVKSLFSPHSLKLEKQEGMIFQVSFRFLLNSLYEKYYLFDTHNFSAYIMSEHE